MIDEGVFVLSTPACARTTEPTHVPHPPTDECSYRVAWSINPHMCIGGADPGRAMHQHEHFVSTLQRLGARVMHVPFVHGAYDSIFAKDNALLVDRDGQSSHASHAGHAGHAGHARSGGHGGQGGHTGEALMASPVHQVRKNEQWARARALRSLGFRIHAAPREAFEGGDLVMLPGMSGALLGHGFRSSPHATRAISTFLGAPVTPIELIDPELYHLDTALAVLSDGTALLCRDAISRASLRALWRVKSISAIVAVPREEAAGFAANIVEVGHHVLLGRDAPRTRAALEARGRTTHVVPLDEFHKAGGSASCLVARVHGRKARCDSGAVAAQSVG